MSSSVRKVSVALRDHTTRWSKTATLTVATLEIVGYSVSFYRHAIAEAKPRNVNRTLNRKATARAQWLQNISLSCALLSKAVKFLSRLQLESQNGVFVEGWPVALCNTSRSAIPTSLSRAFTSLTLLLQVVFPLTTVHTASATSRFPLAESPGRS